jgi:hypothetical protein
MEIDERLQHLVQWRDLGRSAPDSDENRFFEFCLKNLGNSRSQNFQELFVLYELGSRKGGYFVEFGAADGVYLSNSHLLEFEFGWHGILAEPARSYQTPLRKARNCAIDSRCVWSRSGEIVSFLEAPEPELSTIAEFVHSDRNGPFRVAGAHYDVMTVSLGDLLDHHRAPRRIDYMSVDTEGTELEILSAFDFNAYDIRVMTIEHNHTQAREPIFELLSSKGFVRKFERFSRWDDWFVKAH